MRILIVHNYYQDFGGEDVVFKQEASMLSTINNNEVYTLTYQNQKGWKGLFQFLLSPWNILAANKLRKKIVEIRPDIIHFHNTQYAAGPILIRVAKKLGVPVVMSLHNFRLLCPSATLFYRGHLFEDSLSQNFPWSAVNKSVLDNSLLKTFWTAMSYWIHRKIRTWNMVDRYFVLAEFSKQLFAKSTLGIPSDKFIVKPNFVDIPEHISTANRHSHYLYVGRLSAEKGILDLLKLLAGSLYKLYIAGTGPQLEEVQNIINGCDNFTYLGSLDKSAVHYELSRCRGLIVPSICYEGGVPLTILEAFATKTPVLASRIGAIADVVKDGKTGFTFDIKQPTTLNLAFQQLEMLNEQQLSTIVEQAYHIAATQYNRDTVITILQEQYNLLIKAKS